jgi:hypothetical protein
MRLVAYAGLVIAAWLVSRFVPIRYRLAVWILVIAGIVVPWGRLQDHPRWDRIRWIPLVSPPVRLSDVVGNIALYVPLGMFCAPSRSGRAGVIRAATLALVLSGLTEATQLFSDGRFPSMGDLAMNVLGALIGAVAVTRTRQTSSTPV